MSLWTFCGPAIICLSECTLLLLLLLARQGVRLKSPGSTSLEKPVGDQGKLSSTYRMGLIKRPCFTSQNLTLGLLCPFSFNFGRIIENYTVFMVFMNCSLQSSQRTEIADMHQQIHSFFKSFSKGIHWL